VLPPPSLSGEEGHVRGNVEVADSSWSEVLARKEASSPSKMKALSSMGEFSGVGSGSSVIDSDALVDVCSFALEDELDKRVPSEGFCRLGSTAIPPTAPPTAVGEVTLVPLVALPPVLVVANEERDEVVGPSRDSTL